MKKKTGIQTTVEPRIETIHPSPARTKAEQIEQMLIDRMHERYMENDVPEDVISYFEMQQAAEEHGYFPYLSAMGNRKQRTIANARGACDEEVSDGPHSSCPPTTNRGVTFNHGPNDPTRPDLRMGGYDGGVELGFQGVWQDHRFEAVKALLTPAKQAAIDNDTELCFVELGGKLFKIKPKNVNAGCNFEFALDGDGMTILIHGKPESKKIQQVRIRYNAEGLIGRDLFLKHSETVDWLAELGFSVTEEKLTRVDMQIMLFRDVEEFFEQIYENRMVCTAQKWNIHGKGVNKASTFTMGSDIQVCIYDKREELFSGMRKHPEKMLLMVENCFGDDWLTQEIPTTRVEFRLRRDWLKMWQIDTMQDLMECEQGIARYCCASWFRLLSEPKKAGHTSRQEVSELWREVQEAFAVYFPGVDGHRRDIRKRERADMACNVDGDVAQARGCLAKGIAYFYGAVETVEEALEKTRELLLREGGKFISRIADYANTMTAKSGLARDFVQKQWDYTDFGPVVMDVAPSASPVASWTLFFCHWPWRWASAYR